MSSFKLSREPIQNVTELETLKGSTAEAKAGFLSEDTQYHPSSLQDSLLDLNERTSPSEQDRNMFDSSSKKSPLRESPALLTRHSLKWYSLLMDLFVIVSTLPFFALAGIVAWLGGRIVEENQWRDVLNGTRIAATLFPIVFAAIAGRLVTKAATWKLEKGSKLGTLEQLVGSKTVFATISTQFGLRSFNALGVSLVFFWALSPMGGQSALRIIDTGFTNTFSESPIVYFSTDAPSQFVKWVVFSGGAAGAVADRFVQLNAMFSTALLTPVPTKLSGVDLWNNIKIPRLSSYEQKPSSAWSEIPLNPYRSGLAYSSLVGIPVFDIPRGNSSFLLESSYMELNCTNMTTTPRVEPTNASFLNEFDSCGWMPCPYIANGTFQGVEYIDRNASISSTSSTPRSYTTWALAMDTFINTTFWEGRDFLSPANLTSQVGITANQATLLFQSANVQEDMYRISNINYTHAYCKVNQRYVESRVNCSNFNTRQCSVVAQRESQQPHATSTITQISWPQVFRTFTSSLPRANGASGDDGLSDLALYHIQNTTSEVINSYGLDPFKNTTLEQFSDGLGQILNTYMLLGQAYTLITRSTYAKGDPLLLVTQGVRRNQTSLAVLISRNEIYVTSSVWLGVFGFSLTVLLLAGIASVAFSHLTTTPEIMGSTSLLVRNSKHVHLPGSGGTLDGIDLTKALKNLEVKMGEVERNSDGAGVLGVGKRERVIRAEIGTRYF